MNKENTDSNGIEVAISSKLDSRGRQIPLERLFREIEHGLEGRKGGYSQAQITDNVFINQYAQERKKDDILTQDIIRPFSYTGQKTVMMATGSHVNLKHSLDTFRPIYEQGEGIVRINDIFNRKVQSLPPTSSLLEDMSTMYSRVSVRGQMVEGNNQLIRNTVILSKFFSDRLGYVLELKADLFGIVHRLPLKFIIYLNDPRNVAVKREFISGNKEWSRLAQGENNLIFPEGSDKTSLVSALRTAMVGGDSDKSKASALKRGKFNKEILVEIQKMTEGSKGLNKVYTYTMEESDGASKASDSLGFFDKKKDKKKNESKGITDLKALIKPRQKVLLKKFVRIHVLTEEASQLQRRPSMDLIDGAPDLPASKELKSECLSNRRNFNFEEDKKKRDAIRMKKINKLAFTPFHMKRIEEDEITVYSHEHWKRHEKDPIKLASKTALEFSSGSIVSSNIRAKLLINHPAVIFSGKQSMNVGSPSGYSMVFVILVGWRLYVYDSQDSKRAKVVFEIEPRDMEKGLSPTPGWYSLANSYQDPLYFSMEKEGPKLLKYLDIVIGYQSLVHMYEQTGNIRFLTSSLTDFYSDPYEPRYVNIYEKDIDSVTTLEEEMSITEGVTDKMKGIIYMTLKPIKYHKLLTELTIVNIHLSSRCVSFLFEAIHYVKPNLKVLRLEYNEFGPDVFNNCIVRYINSELFTSMDVLSVSGNRVGDSSVDALLTPISKLLETEMFSYAERGEYPLSDIRLADCGLTNASIKYLDSYFKSLDKIRLASKSPALRLKLDVSKNYFDDKGIIDIVEILGRTSVLSSLDLSESFSMTPSGLIKLFGCLDKVAGLEEIFFRELYITLPMVPFVQRMFYRNPHLHRIDLSFEKNALKSFMSSKHSLTKYFGMRSHDRDVYGNRHYAKVQRQIPDGDDPEAQVKYNYKLGMKREELANVQVVQEEKKGRRYR